jgi:hypothetical protein
MISQKRTTNTPLTPPVPHPPQAHSLNAFPATCYPTVVVFTYFFVHTRPNLHLHIPQKPSTLEPHPHWTSTQDVSTHYFFRIFSLPTLTPSSQNRYTLLLSPPDSSETSPTLHSSIHLPRTRPCPVKHNIGHT